MRLTLAFSKSGAAIEIPDAVEAQVLESRHAAKLPDADAALAEAVARPIAGPALEDLARGKKSAAISVCDITRPAPNRTVLPHVIAALERGGIERQNITILIATGLHRPATEAELDEIVGRDIWKNYPVFSHQAREIDEQTYLGETQHGTPIFIDSRFIDADLHISLGFIEPHLMAGFSGGRKLISIGLAGERTIKQLHSSLYMRAENASEGHFPENPLHRELIEIASIARHDFMIDVALTADRSIAAVFAGEPGEAHRRGVEFVRESTMSPVDEPVDAVITTSGGYPLDLTYYQSVKGVTAASHVVREGGEILLIAACNEGLGSPEFSELVRRHPDPRGYLRALDIAPVTIDQWQIEKLALVAKKATLSFCLPGVDPDDRSNLWGASYETPQEAVDSLISRLPRGGRLVVIPEGPYVFSQLQEQPVFA